MIRLTVVSVLTVSIAALPAVPQVRVDSTPSWRIIGGDDALEGAFPFIISLRELGTHSCSGVIIDENFVLTAAHCVNGTSPSNFTIVAGSNKLDSGGTTYEVSQITAHENYSLGFLAISNDIALLRTSTPIDFSDASVGPVSLPTENPEGGLDVAVAGWGTLIYDGAVPNNLQYLNLSTISDRDCMEALLFFPVHETNVCAFAAEGRGVCQGDAGSPLVTPNNTLVGLSSWGIICGEGLPDVYTRVYSFLGWIRANVEV